MFFKEKPSFIQDKEYFIEDKIAEYVPIACHFDKETLLTKNGELLQIIEVTGFEPNDKQFQKINLRNLVRESLKKHVTEHKYAIYLHVIRNRRNMVPHGEMPFGFADDLNKKWCRKNNWDKQLVNTLYITIVHQNIHTPIYNLKALIFPLIRNKHLSYLEEACTELHELTNKISVDLKRFYSRKLTTIHSEDDGYISEPLAFYHNLAHLSEKKTPAPLKDLSDYLANIKLTYKFNTIEIEGADFKRYAAIFSVKQAHNLPVEAYDIFLQLGIQFIITEVMYFTPSSVSLKSYTKMMDYLEASQTTNIAKDNDLEEIIGAKQNSPNDYCSHQITILIYSDDEKFFQDKINKATQVWSEMGLITVREDFNMSRCFWSQLPGNFKFICRTNYTATKVAAAFTSIHHKNMGCYNGSKWGPAITLFRNVDGNPYYFNFHSHNNGNTLMIGPEGAGKTVFIRFFLTQAIKLKPRLIYIDVEGGAEKFIEEVGGLHVKPDPSDFSPLKINPFNLKLFNNDIELATHFFTKLIYARGSESDQYKPFFEALVKAAFEKEGEDKYSLIKNIIESSEDQAIKDSFNSSFNAEIYANFFDEDFLDILTLEDILSIDVSGLVKSPALFEAFLVLLLLKIPSTLDGRPTIIALNRSYNLFYNKAIAPLLASWLDTLTEKNAIAFFSTGSTDAFLTNPYLQECLGKFATQIFLSNKFVDKYFKRAFKLSEWELYKVKSYDKERRMFLLKQGEYSIVGVLNLSDLPGVVEVLK